MFEAHFVKSSPMQNHSMWVICSVFASSLHHFETVLGTGAYALLFLMGGIFLLHTSYILLDSSLKC